MVNNLVSVCSQQLLIMFSQPENPARDNDFQFYRYADNIGNIVAIVISFFFCC